MVMIAAGLMVNLRRIWRYRHKKREENQSTRASQPQKAAEASFLSQIFAILRRWLRPRSLRWRWNVMGVC
jgi:hypothetical protein